MDPGLRSPLVDFFKRGEAARDVCLMAAAGTLAPRAHEQLALLVLLSDDGDPEVAATANATLALLPPDPLRAFLARSDVPAPMRDFFAARGMTPGDQAAVDADAPLIDAAADTPPAEESEEPEGAQVLASLPIIERMKLAMKGTKGQRAQLIRDSNKLVAAAVLEQPETDRKRSRNVLEDGECQRGCASDDRDEPVVGEELRGHFRADEKSQDAAGNFDADAAAAE